MKTFPGYIGDDYISDKKWGIFWENKKSKSVEYKLALSALLSNYNGEPNIKG